MAITITERRVGDVTVLEIKGRIVFHDGAAVLRAQINELLDQARLKILLDLRDVTYIDSFGVGVIATKYVSLKRKGGDLRLFDPRSGAGAPSRSAASCASFRRSTPKPTRSQLLRQDPHSRLNASCPDPAAMRSCIGFCIPQFGQSFALLRRRAREPVTDHDGVHEPAVLGPDERSAMATRR